MPNALRVSPEAFNSVETSQEKSDHPRVESALQFSATSKTSFLPHARGLLAAAARPDRFSVTVAH